MEKVLEAIPDLIFLLDSDGRIIDVNSNASSDLLMPPDQFIFKKVHEVLPMEVAEKLEAALIQAIKSPNIPQTVTYSLSIDDDNKHFEARLSKLDQDQILCIVRNITDWRNAQIRLEESEQKYRTLTENIKDVLWKLDVDTFQYTYVSHSVKELRGYEPSEIIGTDLNAAYAQPLTDEEKAQIELLAQKALNDTAFRKRYYRSEVEQTCKDGSTVWTEVISRYHVNEQTGKVELHGVTRDISERVLSEKKLKELSELQSILMKIAADYINVDLSHIDKRINKSLADMGTFVDADRVYIFQYIWDIQITKNTYEWCAAGIEPQIDELQELPLELVPQWVASHQKGEEIYVPNVMDLDPESGLRQILEPQGVISLLTIPMMDGDNCLGFVGFDFVREQYLPGEKEKALLSMFAQLLVNIELRRKSQLDLIAEKEKADAANRSKSEFLANMSHEIRTPLNGVIGFTDLLMTTPLTPLQRQYTENANVSGKSLLGIINDILDFSKIEAGKLELDPILTDIFELLEQVVDIIKFQAARKNLELLLNVDLNTPAMVLVDPIRLKQVLTNLLNNAVKFTERGEVELRLEYKELEEAEQGLFTFSIRDTGIGITDDQRTKLFKAFSQADTSTTRKYGGTGLGLSISNLLVEKMGGSIAFESRVGQGSTFYFELPLSFQKNKPIIEDGGDAFIESAIVIDDNDNNRLVLEHNFIHWGIKFRGFDNGLSAIKYIEKHRDFDMLIVDYHMPYMDGLETIEIIRKKMGIGADDVPIILLHSSTDDITIRDASKRLSIQHSLVKPVKARELYFFLKKSVKHQIKESPSAHESVTTNIPKNQNKEKTILIVEDVAMNMILVKSYLSEKIPDATILEASNGRIGIELFEKHPIDLILMDIQMPEMDGLETTKHIRELDKVSGKHTPIIALTAGALKEEKERALEAGMDDFLTKPLQPDLLFKAIEKHLNYSYTDIGSSVQLPTSREQFALWQLVGGNEQVYKTLLEAALDINTFMAQLKEGLLDKDEPALKSAFHKLKGAAATLTFKELATAIEQLEHEWSASPDKVMNTYAIVLKKWEVISDWIRKELNSLDE